MKFLCISKHKHEHHILLPFHKPNLAQRIIPNPVRMLCWKGIKYLSISFYICVLPNFELSHAGIR
jgi:hypothetical protein